MVSFFDVTNRLIDYVLKPNPVFAHNDVMLCSLCTTTTFFAITNFFHQSIISLWVTYTARNANEKMLSILQFFRRDHSHMMSDI